MKNKSFLEIFNWNNCKNIVANNKLLSKKWEGDYEIVFKSYLERNLLDTIKQEIASSVEKIYIITFNENTN